MQLDYTLLQAAPHARTRLRGQSVPGPGSASSSRASPHPVCSPLLLAAPPAAAPPLNTGRRSVARRRPPARALSASPARPMRRRTAGCTAARPRARPGLTRCSRPSRCSSGCPSLRRRGGGRIGRGGGDSQGPFLARAGALSTSRRFIAWAHSAGQPSSPRGLNASCLGARCQML